MVLAPSIEGWTATRTALTWPGAVSEDSIARSHADPKLLLLVTSTQRRGGEVLGSQIRHGLIERGWDVRIRALVRGDGPTIDAEPLIDKPRAALRTLDLSVIRALRREIRSFDPLIVFANGGATLPAAVGASPFGGGRRLAYGSIGEPLFWASTPVSRRRLGFLLRRADLVTAVSHATRNQIVDGLGVEPERAEVVHPGVEPRFFEVAAEPPTTELRVLFLGSLAPEKDPQAAIDVVERADASAAVRMRIVGAGPLGTAVEESVSTRELSGIVEIAGPVSDVRPHLGWADVLLLPSKSEGLPGVVLEAAAAGVATVAYRVGGVADVVEDGVTGLLVEAGDVGAMASSIVRLAEDRSLTERLGKAVREKVRRGFRAEQTIDRYDEVFRRLVATAGVDR